MRYLLYRNKAVKRIRLKIDPASSISRVAESLKPLALPEGTLLRYQPGSEGVPAEAVMPRLHYVLREAVRNAQEAHRARGLSEKVLLTLEAQPRGLGAVIADQADSWEESGYPEPSVGLPPVPRDNRERGQLGMGLHLAGTLASHIEKQGGTELILTFEEGDAP